MIVKSWKSSVCPWVGNGKVSYDIPTQWNSTQQFSKSVQAILTEVDVVVWTGVQAMLLSEKKFAV